MSCISIPHSSSRLNMLRLKGIRLGRVLSLMAILLWVGILTVNATQSSFASQSVGARAATLWWLIFNEPDACVSNPGQAEQCGEVDVFGQAYLESVRAGAPDPTLITPNTEAGLAVIYATGGQTDWYGHIRLVASIYRPP